MFYGDRVERTIPAEGGRTHVLRLINDLLDPAGAGAPTGPTNLAPLLDAGPGDQAPLAGVRDLGLHQHARLGALHGPPRPAATRCSPSGSVDPREVELPDVGLMLIEDAETGERLEVDTRGSGVPAAVRGGRRTAARRRSLASFKRSGVDAASISTDEDLVGAIVRLAARRRVRRS